MYQIIFETKNRQIPSDLFEAMNLNNTFWQLQEGYLVLLAKIDLKNLNRVLVVFGKEMESYYIYQNNELIDSYNKLHEKDIPF